MTENKFKATKNGKDSEFPICWTGQDDQGNHFGVSTDGIQASRLDTVSEGAEGDAKLIAALLDRHYSGVDAALQARVAELEAENSRKAFRLGWIKENYDDTTALRFALKADDSEIDEMIARAG